MEVNLNRGFSETKEWDEWLWIWQENIKGKFSRKSKINVDIALQLLHIGPKLFSTDSYRISDFRTVKFYLNIAWWDSSDYEIEQSRIGEKAYQILVTKLLRNLNRSSIDTGWYIESEVGINLVKQIIKFFAYCKRYFPGDDERYLRSTRIIIRGLYAAITKDDSIATSLSWDAKKILLGEKKNLARALVNIGALDCITDEKIFEAIPILEKKIADYIWKQEYKKADRERLFPGGKEEFTRALDKIDPKALELVFKIPHSYPGDEPKALVELLALRPKN